MNLQTVYYKVYTAINSILKDFNYYTLIFKSVSLLFFTWPSNLLPIKAS